MARPDDTSAGGIAWLRERLGVLVRDVFQPGREEAFSLVGHMKTNPGLVRSHNEDCVAYTIFSGAEAARRPGLLAIVADGMGGHAHGEVASRIAIDTVMKTYCGHPDLAPRAALARGFAAANAAVLDRAATAAEHAGMGTTCTALAIEAGQATLAHIGDSRAYLWRGGAISQISDDHSLVAQMVRDGLISEQEAAVHPDRNVITDALGLDAQQKPDVWTAGMPVELGDVFCLCSDGLSNLVDIENIGAVLAQLDPEAACSRLVDAALEAGGHDNISVGVFRANPVRAAPAPAITARLTATTDDLP